jgi:CheY-like chemotaxis protein
LLILAQQLEDNPDDNMTPAQVNYASVIRSSGNDLLNLLNSILELAKVESGTVVVERTELFVENLRAALLRDFEHVARGKELAFAIDVAPDGPKTVITDPQRLHQILNNLLANAFKFTAHGEVHVNVGLAYSGWSRERESLNTASSVVAISVRDTGIGVEQDQQMRIFEAFVQGDGTTARNYGGTGLGLSISRELAHLLGGELVLFSKPGHGSTFTVYLPSGESATAAAAMRPPKGAHAVAPFEPLVVVVEEPADAINGNRSDHRRSAPSDDPLLGTKVLVVDDDFRNLFAMTALLERVNAVVIVAEGGAEALTALNQDHDIDIVLMDIMMPLMDGYATIRAIRGLDHCKSLPIVAVTGKVVAGEHKRCIEAGANDYVPKPVDSAELLAVMRPWLPVRPPAAS